MSLEFCKLLPKIELHAHLNGSLSNTTLKKLGCLEESIQSYQKLTTIIQKSSRTLDECFTLFKVAQNATNTTRNVYIATQDVIKEFHDDNVIYLELRTTPRAEETMTKEDYIEAVVSAIKSNPDGIVVKLILSLDRRHDSETSQESLRLICKMKAKYPDIIRGIDLSGNPADGCFDPELFKQAKQVELFSAIHCAEIRNDEEVAAILDFGPDRLGHATFLHENSENWNVYLQKRIPIECCISSNVICGTSKDYKDHHVQKWITNNLPFSISTDDKGVFCTNSTQEHHLIAKYFNRTNAHLFEISLNAVNHSFASSEEKATLTNYLNKWKIANKSFFY